MNEFNDKSFFTAAFSDSQMNQESSFSVERINDLLQNNSISAYEHSFLLRTLYPIEKRVSTFAWLCLSSAIVSWFSFLTFSFYETKYELMSGANRFRVLSVLVPLIYAFFFLARREIRTKHDVKGFEIAFIGLIIAVAQSTVLIPGWLMYFYSEWFYK